MAFSTFVFLIVLQLALSLPQPDPNVKVVVDVEVDDRGCGCCNNENCCTYDGVKYRSGYNLVVGCVKLCCKHDGEWEFTGIIEGCGNCTAGGEPWIRTFDDVTGAYRNHDYWTNATGTYVLTQQGVTRSPSYRVNGDFSYLNHSDREDGSYLKGVTYKENSQDKISLACDPGDIGATWPLCTNIQVHQISPPTSTKYFTCTRNIYIGSSTFNCKGFVGTEGLTVMLCVKGNPITRWQDLPWAYIYAPTSLKAPPSELSKLYGLCNLFTGHTKDFYTQGPYPPSRPGLSRINCFRGLTGDDKYNIDIICSAFIESWKP